MQIREVAEIWKAAGEPNYVARSRHNGLQHTNKHTHTQIVVMRAHAAKRMAACVAICRLYRGDRGRRRQRIIYYIHYVLIYERIAVVFGG